MTTITPKPAIDIFDMLDPEKEAKKAKFRQICQHIKTLKDGGMKSEDIQETIKALNLPLDMHLAIFGRFTEVCKHGKVLTVAERRIYG